MLMWAADHGHHTTCKLLLQAGAKIDLQDTVSSNLISTYNLSPDVCHFQYLVQQGGKCHCHSWVSWVGSGGKGGREEISMSLYVCIILNYRKYETFLANDVTLVTSYGYCQSLKINDILYVCL